MAIEGLVGGVEIESLVNQVSFLVRIFQAIGGLIIAYIIFSVINTIIERKKRNELRRMRELLEQINKKLTKKK